MSWQQRLLNWPPARLWQRLLRAQQQRPVCSLKKSPLKEPGLDPTDPANHTGITTRDVPLHQGIFQKNFVTGELTLVAQTGSHCEDFLFWNFSGNAGQSGEVESEEEEGARWRSTAFFAADGQGRVQGHRARCRQSRLRVRALP